MRLAFELNDVPVVVEAAPFLSLADLLRSSLATLSVHLGCEQGVCGACTVLVEEKTVRSCLMLAVQTEGRRVTTAEGIAARHGQLWAEIESTFVATGAFQCGFCTSGMVVCLEELLVRAVPVGRREIIEQLSGQICRCTGYSPILSTFEAVLQAANLLADDDEGGPIAP